MLPFSLATLSYESADTKSDGVALKDLKLSSTDPLFVQAYLESAREIE